MSRTMRRLVNIVLRRQKGLEGSRGGEEDEDTPLQVPPRGHSRLKMTDYKAGNIKRAG